MLASELSEMPRHRSDIVGNQDALFRGCDFQDCEIVFFIGPNLESLEKADPWLAATHSQHNCSAQILVR